MARKPTEEADPLNLPKIDGGWRAFGYCASISPDRRFVCGLAEDHDGSHQARSWDLKPAEWSDPVPARAEE